MCDLNSSNSTPSTSRISVEPSLSGEYDVFLSFCGKDTRKRFADFLYTQLQGAGVRTFRDDKELPVGEEIGPELTKAIENSKICILIFSKNYASSKWCLLELAHVVKCHAEANGGKMIIPIFYDVEPHDVRHQSGFYEEAFRQYENKKLVEVPVWKKALAKVGGLKGFELEKETNGREGELAELTKKECLHFLKKHHQHVPTNTTRNMHKDITEETSFGNAADEKNTFDISFEKTHVNQNFNMVQLDNHISKLKKSLLDADSDSNKDTLVRIEGMGGLDKTTVAKIIYFQLFQHYKGHSVLENVPENSSRKEIIVMLQSQLISEIQENRRAVQFNRVQEAIQGGKLFQNRRAEQFSFNNIKSQIASSKVAISTLLPLLQIRH